MLQEEVVVVHAQRVLALLALVAVFVGMAHGTLIGAVLGLGFFFKSFLVKILLPTLLRPDDALSLMLCTDLAVAPPVDALQDGVAAVAVAAAATVGVERAAVLVAPAALLVED